MGNYYSQTHSHHQQAYFSRGRCWLVHKSPNEVQTTCKNITFFRQSNVPKATTFHSSIIWNDSKFACSSAPSPIGGDTFSIVDGVYFHSGEAPLARTHQHCSSTQLAPQNTTHTAKLPSHQHTRTHKTAAAVTATRVRSTNQPARGNIYTNERGRDAHRAGEGRGGRPPHDSQQRYFFFCEIALFSDGPKRYLRCPTGYIFTFKSLPIWSANDRRHSRKLKQTDYGRIFALFVVALNTHVCWTRRETLVWWRANERRRSFLSRLPFRVQKTNQSIRIFRKGVTD